MCLKERGGDAMGCDQFEESSVLVPSAPLIHNISYFTNRGQSEVGDWSIQYMSSRVGVLSRYIETCGEASDSGDFRDVNGDRSPTAE